MTRRFFFISVFSLIFISFALYKTVLTPAPYTKTLPKLSSESSRQLPLLFPKQLILGKSPEVLSVTDSSTSSSTAVLVVFKDSQNSVQELYSEYLDYLSHAYWVESNVSISMNLGTLNFSRGIQNVSISIRPDSSQGLMVEVDYHANSK